MDWKIWMTDSLDSLHWYYKSDTVQWDNSYTPIDTVYYLNMKVITIMSNIPHREVQFYPIMWGIFIVIIIAVLYWRIKGD